MSHYAQLADSCNCSCRDLRTVNKETRGVCNELHSCAWEHVLSQTPQEHTITDCSRGTRTHLTLQNWTQVEQNHSVWEPTSRRMARSFLETAVSTSHYHTPQGRGHDLTLWSRTRTKNHKKNQNRKKNVKEATQETGSGLKLQKNKAGEKNQN